MSPFKRTLRSTKRVQHTPRKPARRTRIYGREILTTIKTSTQAVIETGTNTTAYGWTYGTSFKLKFNDIRISLPANVREFKVHRVLYHLTAFMIPADRKIIPIKNGSNDYWPGYYNAEPDHKFYTACVLQDGDGGDGDTHKFKTISDLKSYCLPGKFKFGTCNSQLSFTGLWTPQEPSEQEWFGSRSDLTTLLSLYVYSQTLGTEWYNPDSKPPVERQVQVFVDFTINLVYRGRKSTQQSMIVRQSTNSEHLLSPLSVNLEEFEDLRIPSTPQSTE